MPVMPFVLALCRTSSICGTPVHTGQSRAGEGAAVGAFVGKCVGALVTQCLLMSSAPTTYATVLLSLGSIGTALRPTNTPLKYVHRRASAS